MRQHRLAPPPLPKRGDNFQESATEEALMNSLSLSPATSGRSTPNPDGCIHCLSVFHKG